MVTVIFLALYEIRPISRPLTFMIDGCDSLPIDTVLFSARQYRIESDRISQVIGSDDSTRIFPERFTTVHTAANKSFFSPVSARASVVISPAVY